jgi:hypothetical protein
MRIWSIHSVWSTAPADRQLERPFFSSRPTLLAHSACPAKAFDRSSVLRLGRPACAAAVWTARLIVGSAVPVAQSASAFQRPQPPVDWRVNPNSP